ncbi:TnsA endonuclease N-terminal domain-containing protein [uncultured Oxalicibacterium sp.]|uniref:TnsA endonuclease N-terminal domain-containing protein n=1 Tax=uncultured Oxalicibacterium sp. TaxID=1168540 RepID=UPI0025FE17A0|nr:TnsA endonuclease N-terminal domain-containing protein [uncultured Oxalicibacterium sp.]
MKLPTRRRNGDANKHGRVRNPVGRSFKSIRGKYPSKKMGRMIQWESQLERDAILLLEYSPDITAYQEQPRKITYAMQGAVKTYFPDFEVWHTDGRHGYIEVKPDEIARRPDQKARFSHIESKFNGEGSYFEILTENQIRTKPLLDNLRMVERYRSSALRPTSWFTVKHHFEQLAVITFAQAQVHLGGIDRVWALVADGIFSTDLRSCITDQTIFQINVPRSTNGTDIRN